MQSVVQNLRNVLKLLAVVAILVAIYLFGTELGLQRDMTEANIYSLTERSQSIAGSVEKPTTLYFFHTPSQGGGMFNAERVRTLLKQYARTNEKISFREVDHTRRPNLARQHNVRSNNTILIKSGKSTTKIGRYDLMKFSRRRRGSRKFQGESAVSTALLKMTQATDRTVYFATGHGEYTRSPSRRGRSVSRWVSGLKDEGYTVKEFNPLTDTLPDTRDLIVVVGPTKQFSKDILKGLRKWKRRGGKLLVAAGATTGHSLNPLTKPVGLAFNKRYVIDPARRVQSLQSLVNPFVFAPVIQSHPAVKAVKKQGLGIQMGRGTTLTVISDTPQAVLKTSGEAFGKPASGKKKIRASYNPETDVRGPFTVGAIVSTSDRGKLLAFASPTLFGNRYLQSAPGNEDFAINLVNWTFNRDVSLGIRATPSDYNRVTVPASQAYLLEIISLGVIPFGIIIWGGLVWWNRKNR